LPGTFRRPRAGRPIDGAPWPNSRDDCLIFSGLAERPGVGKVFAGGRSASEWISLLHGEYRDFARRSGIGVPDLETLKQRNRV